MSERRAHRDARRRSLGQNFLTDPSVVERLVDGASIDPGELVIDLGAGGGALTIALARAGARVRAVEIDPVWVRRLSGRVKEQGLADRVEVVRGDIRRTPLPDEPYRVVASPPFGLTTAVLSRLLDEPAVGPWRADLLIQREVTAKRTAQPPTSLRTAAWAPWWTFEMGMEVARSAFRPVPSVDAAVLVARRRPMPVLPDWLAFDFRELLRPGWDPPAPR